MSISPAVVSRIATVSPSAGVVCIVVFGIGVSVTLSRHPVSIKVLARVNKRRVLNFFMGLGLGGACGRAAGCFFAYFRLICWPRL